jgi:hypothetical protein
VTLAEPPQAAGALAALPGQALRGRRLFRLWRFVTVDGAERDVPWWFASVPGVAADGGRFDLPAPMGACYTGTRAVAAVLEALQVRLVNLPRAELTVRRLAEIRVPGDAHAAAKVTARSAAGTFGVTAALWAGTDRLLTQRWAAALRRDGWWAVYGGVHHDPSGQLRAVTLFDSAGEHAPTWGSPWEVTVSDPADDAALHAQLAVYGVAVRDPGDLPFADPPV